MSVRERLGRDKTAVSPAELDARPTPGYVRVNLLPDSVIERERVRRAKTIALIIVALAVAAVAGWWLMIQQQMRSAEADLAAAEATGLQLQQEAAQYADVPLVFAAAEQGEQALTLAMGGEVRWSFLLNQLTFATPSGIDLQTVAGAISEGGTVQTSPGGVLTPKESVGTMTFAGGATNFDNVAAWLDSLEGLKDYTYPFLNSSVKEESETGTSDVAWESAADLNPNALSGRYGVPAPSDAGTAPAPAPTPEAVP